MFMTFKIVTKKMSPIGRNLLLNRNLNLNTLKHAYSQNSGPVTEAVILNKLRQKFPQAKAISVEDTSGGCGAMFNIFVEAKEFKDLSIMKQHRMIYDVLKEQIESIHGLHLETKVPK